MFKKHFLRTLTVLLALLTVCASLPMAAIAATINPPADGNFTLLWVTDPQWYTFAYQDVLQNQNQWVVDNYNRMDMRYIFHTGDFVDLPHATDQWDFASAQYKLWDDAGLAYGILAGNHDVDGSDHTEFSQYFGKSRYDKNPWYGGDYDNHFGHYDLMTIDGVEFVFVYMGYGTRTQAEYDWMNSVLSTYSDRIAVLSFHEYLAASGERTATGEAIFQNFVLKNPNVRMVLCGHNYNSTRKVQEIDDNGDGRADRTVYQMMANYQNTTRGGNGFMRFMECDVQNGTITHRTYSSYTQSFGSEYEDGTVIDEYGYRDEFIVPFDFSAPTPKGANDPEKGTVVVSPKVTFALNGSSAAAMFAVDDQTVGVYDRNFSLNAADAFDNVSNVTFVTTKYNSNGSHSIASVTKGSSLSASAYVPIPQDGVVIALSNNAIDETGKALNVNELTVGRKVYVQGLTNPPGVKSVHLNVPSLNTTFNISAINRLTGNNEWNLYDSGVGSEAVSSSETHTWDMLFGFTPKSGNTYTLTALNTTLGEAKTMTIPQNGFVLSVNTFSGQNALRDSLRAKFVKDLEVTLNGHTPGTEPVFDLTDLLPAAVSGWNYDSTQMQVTDEAGAHTFYKTSGNWPAADIDYTSPITFDPANTAFYYDLTMETGSKSNIILFFKNSNSVSST
ncbi:MAG: metallophosphoesterase, partial [Clostridia bacterium]|nr:metallophosphoesterase [Clostridia bacterium]